MAKFRISGPDAMAFLDYVGSAKSPTEPGKIALTLMLNKRGGIVGDMTIEHARDGSFYCVGATLGVALYQRWMRDHTNGFDVHIENITDHVAALGIAGPHARALLNSLSNAAFDDFPFMTSAEVEIGRVRVKAMRVSFSGELGWELHCPMLNQKALF